MIQAQMLIKNANIITLDGSSSHAGSLAVTNGIISGIWPESEPSLREIQLSSHTEVIDLGGRVLIPGFVDTHNHILSYGLSHFNVNCSTPPHRKIGDFLNRINLQVKETK
jgi:predicted amidohydrolase YtcJ